MASFIPNPNLLRELAEAAEVKAAMSQAAQRIARTAQTIAPVGDANEDDHPGQFRDSIHAEGNQVIADDPAAVSIIFGTSHSPPHDTLRRAAEMEGAHVMKEHS